MNSLEIYEKLVEENAITETFGDYNPEKMAEVFLDYEIGYGEIVLFLNEFADLIDLNGMDTGEMYRQILEYMEDL